MSTPEQDLDRHLEDIADDERREERIIAIQEEWDYMTYLDPNDNTYKYIIWQRPSKRQSQHAFREVIGADYGFLTESDADDARLGMMNHLAEGRLC